VQNLWARASPQKGRHMHGLPVPTHPASSFQSSIRSGPPPCINASTGILRHKKRTCPMWTKPAYTDLRIGFEVTMYFANR